MKQKIASLLKTTIGRKVIGIPVLAIIGMAIVLMAGGIIFAATTITYHGKMSVVPPGGGGGGGVPPSPTYTFEVYDAVTDGAIVTDALFDLGSITYGYSVTKTVYVKNTGNTAVQVTASVVGLESGTVETTPVTAEPYGARVPLVIKFIAGTTAATDDTFDITFTGNP